MACALKHHTRRGERDPERWQVASQLVTHALVRDAGFTLPPDAEAWDDPSVEQAYDRLPTPEDGDSGDDGDAPSGAAGAGGSAADQLSPDGDDDGTGDPSDSAGDGDPQDQDGGGGDSPGLPEASLYAPRMDSAANGIRFRLLAPLVDCAHHAACRRLGAGAGGLHTGVHGAGFRRGRRDHGRARTTAGPGGGRPPPARRGGPKRVMAVESPAKARTIGRWLGPEYRVMATRGHMCDLPAKAGSSWRSSSSTHGPSFGIGWILRS